MTFNAASEQLPQNSTRGQKCRCELPGIHNVPKYAVLPYASGRPGPEPEALKSGLAVVVQCGGTLAKACFPEWRTYRRPPLSARGGVKKLRCVFERFYPRYGGFGSIFSRATSI